MKHLAAIGACLAVFGASVAFGATTEAVVWKDGRNVTISGSALSKSTSAPAALWNAGASSTRALGSGSGYVVFTATAIQNALIGLSHGDSNQSWDDVDYGIYLNAEGDFFATVYGQTFGSYGIYSPGDVFRVEMGADGAIYYIRNGAAFYAIYATAAPPTYPLLVDAALLTPGAGITNVSLYGNLVDAPSIDTTTASAKLFWQHTDGRTAAWYLNGASKTGEASMGSYGGWRFTAVGDLNADARADVLMSDVAGAGYWYARYLDGTIVIGADMLPLEADTSWRVKATGDFNGDGKVDLVWRRSTTGANRIWSMNGATVAAVVTLPSWSDTNWDIVGSADFDRDGHPDLLWRNAATGQNTLWYMSGATKLGEASLDDLTDVNWKAVATGDFDGDAKADILWWNSSTGGLTLWYMDNATRMAQATLPQMTEAGWRPVGYAEPIRAAAPVLSPAPGSFPESVSVGVTCPTTGSTVRYTTNGAAPTESDMPVSCDGSLPFTASTTLKLKAWKAGLVPSFVTVGTYTITGDVPPPTIEPAGGLLLSPQNVVVRSSLVGVTLRYTLNGAEPTESDPTVELERVFVDHALTLKVKGWRTGFTTSPTTSAAFDFTIPPPVFTPTPGSFVVSEDVVIGTATVGAEIRYTTDGTEPGPGSTLYSSPISISTATTIRAKAFKVGFVPSATAIGTYTPAIPTQEGVTQWRNLVNVTADGSSLQHTWVSALGGASSVKAIAAGDGYVEFTVGGPVGEREGGLPLYAGTVVALRNGNTRFQLSFSDTGHVTAIVNAAAVWGGYGNWYNGGDRFRIELAEVSGQPRARFYWNGTLMHEASAAPVYPLVVDVSLGVGGSVQGVVLYGLLTSAVKPVAIVGGPYGTRSRETVHFDGSASYAVQGSLSQYLWSFGDGTTASGSTANHAYLVPGAYTVRLTVVDSNGLTASSTTTANISDAPFNETVVWRNIVNLGTVAGGGPSLLLKQGGVHDTWDAGASSRKAIASGSGWFEFTTGGGDDYLVAGLNNGDRSVLPTDIDFGIWLQPDGHFSIREGDQTIFIPDPADSRFARPYGSPQQFRIVVDASGSQPVVRYYHDGVLIHTSARVPVYPLNADVSVAAHGDGILQPALYGLLTVSHEPVASLGGPYAARPNELIQFDGLGSYDADGSIVAYLWEFGDGATATDSTPTHIYAAEGTYALRLTVTDNSGYTSTAIGAVSVSDAPANEYVIWRNVVRAELLPGGGGGLRKNSATVGWDAGASSRQSIAHGAGWFEFTCGAPEADLALGLNSGDRSVAPEDIDFGVFLAADGKLWIRESTALIGPFGQYNAGQRFRINVNSAGVVQYLKDGSVFYTSTRSPGYPLVADVSISTNGGSFLMPQLHGAFVPHQLPVAGIDAPLDGDPGQLLAIDGGGSFSPNGAISSYAWELGDGTTGSGQFITHAFATPGTYALKLTVVDVSGYTGIATVPIIIRAPLPRLDVTAWRNIVNVAATGNTLTKSDGDLAQWDAGASSKKWLTSGDGYVEVTASETSTPRFFGLNQWDRDRSYWEMRHAMYLASGGAILVSEYGGLRATGALYTPGDVLRIEIVSGVVRFKKNSTIVFISRISPAYPIYIDTAFWTPGASLTNIVFGGHFSNSIPAARPRGYDSWVGDSIEFDGTASYDIDGDIASYAWEFGDGASATGATVSHVYAQPGRYTASLAVTDNEGATRESSIVVTIVAAPDSAALEWLNIVGVSITNGPGGAVIEKVAPTYDWDAGASSRKGIQSGHAYVEFTASALADLVVIGLNHEDVDRTPSDLDHAFLLNSDGSLAVRDNGSGIVTGTYQAGDRLRVEVWEFGVWYKRNGVVIHRGSRVPSYPLYVDMSFGRPGGRVADIVLAGTDLNAKPFALPGGPYATVPGVPVSISAGASHDADGVIESYEWNFGDGTSGTGAAVQHTYLAPGTYPLMLKVTDDDGAVSSVLSAVVVAKPLPLSEVIWENPVDVAVNGNSLSRSAGAAWNAGAVSHQVIAAGDAYIEFTATESDRVRACGFSVSSTATKLAAIDFALVLRDDGSLLVHESGVQRAALGSYAAGDRLRIEITGAVVRYKRNGVALYSSSVAPTYPLRADAAIYSGGGTITDAVISGDLEAIRRLSPPIASPGGGVFASAQGVRLWSANVAADIRFTLDGTEPTATSGLYSAPIEIAVATTLKVKAFRANWQDSETYVAAYSFQYGVLAAPTLAPAGGSFDDPVQVVIAAPSGANVRYTTDGTVPTELSPLYTAPLTIASSVAIQARSFHDGWAPSHAIQGRFVVGTSTDTTAPTITLLEPTNAIPVP